MPQPVKLSDALIDAARTESARADRSLASQIEHWAQLGRMIEPSLTSANTLALKHAETSLIEALPPTVEGRALLEALTAALVREDDLQALLREAGGFPGFLLLAEKE